MKQTPTPAATLLAALAALAAAPAAMACPFCVSEMQTLSEELAGADAAVIARLLEAAPAIDAAPAFGAPFGMVDPDTGLAQFRVDTILKGDDLLLGVDQLEAIYFGRTDFEKRFLIRGIGGPVEWAIPLELSPLAVEYVQQLDSLPAAGADRLAFFQPYLEHEDRQLAQDAYDEFARAPYADLIDLKDRIDRQRVLELINDPAISPSRRRLFFVMLGVCGGPDDLPMLEAMLSSDGRVLVPAAEAMTATCLVTGGPLAATLVPDSVRGEERRRKLGLDAMIACYLTLNGEAGLDLIDRRFLANTAADQTHIYPTLMAMRFLAEEGDIVSMDRLLASARLLLGNENFADQVITDLARWEDWSVIERLGDLYRSAGAEGVSSYVRQPIVIYLDEAARRGGAVAERANRVIAELEPSDPETFAKARKLAAFGFLGRARATPNDDPVPANYSRDALADSDLDPPPDPASFAAGDAGPTEPAAPSDPPAAETLADKPAPAATPAAVDTAPRVPAGAEPLTPPSRLVLLGVPLLAVAGCFGVFWLVLKGGA